MDRVESPQGACLQVAPNLPARAALEQLPEPLVPEAPDHASCVTQDATLCQVSSYGRRAPQPCQDADHGSLRQHGPPGPVRLLLSGRPRTATTAEADRSNVQAQSGASSAASTSSARSAGFAAAYLPILRCRKDTPYWRARLPPLPPRPLGRVQPPRRPRILFGLLSAGRTELTLISPALVKWCHN